MGAVAVECGPALPCGGKKLVIFCPCSHAANLREDGCGDTVAAPELGSFALLTEPSGADEGGV